MVSIEEIDGSVHEDVARADLQWRYGMHEHLFQVRVPEDSVLRFKSLAKSRLGDALGLGVLGIVRDSETRLLPEPDERAIQTALLGLFMDRLREGGGR